MEAGGASRSWVEEVFVVRKWVNLGVGLPLDLLPRGDILCLCLRKCWFEVVILLLIFSVGMYGKCKG